MPAKIVLEESWLREQYHDKRLNQQVGLAEKTRQAWRFADYLARRPFLAEEVMSK